MFYYLEINLVRNGTVHYSVIDDVVPTLQPAPDLISISLSTLPQYINSPDPVAVSKLLHPLLDRVAAKLPPKPGITPGTPRVFIGEFEFPLRNKFGETDGTTPTQAVQVRSAPAGGVSLACSAAEYSRKLEVCSLH